MICGVYGICHCPSPDLGSTDNVQTPAPELPTVVPCPRFRGQGVFGFTGESPQMKESDLGSGKTTPYPARSGDLPLGYHSEAPVRPQKSQSQCILLSGA